VGLPARRPQLSIVGQFGCRAGRDDKTSSVLVLTKDGRTAPLGTLLVRWTSERHNDLVGAASSPACVHPGPRRTRACYNNSTITTSDNQLSQLVIYFGGHSEGSLVAA